MNKLLLVFVLLFSTIVPVSSEELQDLDQKNVAVVEADEDVNTQEDVESEPESKVDLIINTKSYQVEVFSSSKINFVDDGESTYSFISLNPKIASVDSQGYISGVAAGKTEIDIKLTPKTGEAITKKVSVEVFSIEPDPGSIKFTESEFYLIRDLYFEVEYLLEGGLDSSSLIWESSRPSVAEVENGRVTGLEIGSTTITAYSGDASASMEVYVSAPLKNLAYNPEHLEMLVGESKELPALVYAPYDTTTDKAPVISVEDPTIVDLENNVITAKAVGKTKIWASINDVVAELSIEVRPEKNKSGANIITMQIESIQDEQITFKTSDLGLYDQQLFSINLPIEETLDFMNDKTEMDIFIVLDDSMYSQDMKKIDEIILAEEIMEELGNKTMRVHLLNQNNVPMFIYEFHQGHNQAVNLKHSVYEVQEKDPLFSLVNTKAYHVSFKNKGNFPKGTIVKIPAQATDSHYKQLHFVYQVKNHNLVDTDQEVMIDSQDYLNLEVTGESYLITLSKVSKTNDSGVIVTLSIVLFAVLISGIGFYYYKVHYKNKKV